MYCIFSVNLLAVVLLFEAVDCACPTGYTHNFGKKCYLFKDSYANLVQNEDLCRTSGGTLASIGSKAENDFISSFLTKNNGYWIGLRRPTIGVAHFTWMDGSPVNYTNWYPSQPHDLSDAKWGASLYSGHGHGWYDGLATNNRYQLCQRIEQLKKWEPVTHVDGQLLKEQEKLSRDLNDLVKHVIRRVSNVPPKLTIALNKILNIDNRVGQ